MWLLLINAIGDTQSVSAQTIIDTKWKMVSTDEENDTNGISQSDLYQLYAYARRYQCTENILLFPQIYGVTSKGYVVSGEEDTRIRVEFIDVHYDLSKDVAGFQKTLKECVQSRQPR